MNIAFSSMRNFLVQRLGSAERYLACLANIKPSNKSLCNTSFEITRDCMCPENIFVIDIHI